jgi:hypothetical protein
MGAAATGFFGAIAPKAAKKIGGMIHRGKSKPKGDPASGTAMKGIPQAKKGGHVKRTGLCVVHKGETIKPAKISRKPKRGGMKRHTHAQVSAKLSSPPPAKKVQKKSKRKRQYGKR